MMIDNLQRVWDDMMKKTKERRLQHLEDLINDVERLVQTWQTSPRTRDYINDRYPGLAWALDRVQDRMAELHQ